MSFVTQNFWQTFKPVKLIDKARGYFLLAWTQDVTINWLGASEVLMQYNYAATGNFTIDELPDLSGLTDIGIVACIRYQVDGEVTRYKLNEVDGDTTFYPLYNGEVILKNFTIELWSGVSSASLAVAFATVQFNISRLKAKVTLTEDATYEDCVEVSCTGIYNVSTPSFDMVQPVSSGMLDSSNNLTYTFRQPDTQPYTFLAGGSYKITWEAGSIQRSSNSKWEIGLWDITADDGAFMGTIGSATQYNTQLEAETAAAIGATADLNIICSENVNGYIKRNAIINNIVSTVSFKVIPLMILPLQFTACAVGTTN